MLTTNDYKKIKKVRLSIATNEDIISWSSGEVTKPETINYKTHKPEKDGLFDERIFGPIKDFRCSVCGKKHKRADIGKKCFSCGETEIESKLVRRRKMGHIKLLTPVTHIWYSRVDYSSIRSILNLKQDELDSIIYFKSHIIYDNDDIPSLKLGTIIPVQTAPSIYRKILKIILKNAPAEDKIDIQDKIDELVEESTSSIGQNYGIDFYEYNEFIEAYSNIKIGTGAEAIRILLKKFNLRDELQNLKRSMSKKPTTTNFRRIKIIESFLISGQDPSSMVFSVIPVLPADLRPLIELEGGRHSSVDINELYRKLIIRNNRYKNWVKIDAPELIKQNEKRIIQETVDAVFDNARKKIPMTSKDNRPLKSLAENLKGKQGRFRQNLLGKRVDYSGRSVIVVGPELKLHQVGLPKEMVVKLFEPFIVNLLVQEGTTRNIKQAKKMIELMDDRIWKYADRVIKNHPVLLNRAPTLHRLSIQAFEPVITSGKAICLHPLVTPSFNADFDGDQMAVHVPLSKRAKIEAYELMLSTKNVLGPKDGKLMLSPSQDIILGLYFLTKINKEEKKTERDFTILKSYNEVHALINLNKLDIHSIVFVPLSAFPDKFSADIKNGYKYLVTTVGRLVINEKLPKLFPYINEINSTSKNAISEKYIIKSLSEFKEKYEIARDSLVPFNKSAINELIEDIFRFEPDSIPHILDEMKDLGFHYSMISGVSMAITDIVELKKRDSILAEGDKSVSKFMKMKKEGLLTDDQRYQEVVKVWANIKERIKTELDEELKMAPSNPLFMMMDSGARGNISNFVQLAGLRGSMAKATHEYAALKRQNILVRSIEEIPIKSSFKSGLNPFEYFVSTHGARKGLSDTATKTAESGYLTRRLVDAVQDILITEDNCRTNTGATIKVIYDTRTGSVIENIYDRIIGRYAADDIKIKNVVVCKSEQLITDEIANKIQNSELKTIKIRSVLTCNSKRGVCKKCFGLDLTTQKPVNIGEAVGIISAQSIGEPGTQLTMRTFHTGGVAGVSDITQGFARLMELVDANKNPKSASVIVSTFGKITSIEPLTENSKGKIKTLKVVLKSKKDIVEYVVKANDILRVKVGDEVKPGDKITEGSIKLQELLDCAGPIITQSYLIKEMQRIYRLQGINIADKYMEVIIRQMLSKIQIIEPGASNLYTSQIVSQDQVREINQKLFKENKAPAFGKQVIIGVKPLHMKSESFLASASYQRTAEALMNAAISGKVDNLFGIKENLIVGNKIPVGTGMRTLEGKYDIFPEETPSIIPNNRTEFSDEDFNIEFEDEIRIINK